MTSDAQHSARTARTGGRGIATAGAGSGRGVRSARRHSLLVRTLKFGLPVACVVLGGVYAFSLAARSGLGVSLEGITLPKILPENLTMDNPKYEGFGKDGSSYMFAAATAQQELADMNLIRLNTITGTILETDKTRTDVAAKTGVFHQKTNMLELFEEIGVASESGLKAKLTRASIDTKQSIVTSNEPVLVEMPSGTIRSRAMRLDQKKRDMTFHTNVEADLKPPPKAETAAAAPAGAGKAPESPSLFAASDEPIKITSARLDIKDAERIATFTGNVRAVQGEQIITTPELKVTYDGGPEGAAPVDGKAVKSAPRSAGAMAGGKLSRIVAAGPVVITRGTTDRVTAATADFNAATEQAILAGNVVMSSGEDRTATADRADLDQKNATVVLSGAVVVTQGKTNLTGGRLHIDRRAGTSQLTSPPGSPSQRITAHFDRGGAGPKGGAKKPDNADKSDKANKQAAGAGGAFGGNFKTDPNAPLDVEANQLDINDAAHIATFRGAVKAVQGKFVIESAELEARYSGKAGIADMGAAPTKPVAKAAQDAKADTATEITRVIAKKNVVVTGGEGQTVTGDWADFDAKTNKVVVGGAVTMTQNQNTIQGTRLVIDMDTGESTIDSAPGDTVAIPGGGGWTTEGGDKPVVATPSGRANAVFFPMQAKQAMEAAKGGKAEKSGKAAAGSGWEVKTEPGASGRGKP